MFFGQTIRYAYKIRLPEPKEGRRRKGSQPRFESAKKLLYIPYRYFFLQTNQENVSCCVGLAEVLCRDKGVLGATGSLANSKVPVPISCDLLQAWLKYCAETREYWERQARLVTSLANSGTSPEQVNLAQSVSRKIRRKYKRNT
jgi:hypothetical protein